MTRRLAILLSLQFVGCWACSTDIENVTDFKAMMSDMDLILDVRIWNEYTGSGDDSCNSGNDPNKCNYGHHSSMHFLENLNRDDKAAVYKVDGTNTIEESLITALKKCYGDAINTTKIMTSCHSGSRSGAFQQKLVDAGFACSNVYNFVPGAKGLYLANETMDKTASNPGPFNWTSCPADKNGPTGPESTTTGSPATASSASVIRGFGFGLALLLLAPLLSY